MNHWPLLPFLVTLACAPESDVGEIVDSSAVRVFEDPSDLQESCVAVGRVRAEEVSSYLFDFLYSRDAAEAVAIGRLGDEAERLGGDTIVLDRDAFVEVIGLDGSRKKGIGVEGDAYDCQRDVVPSPRT